MARRRRRRETRAFSSEVDTGSREENASKPESRAPLRFNWNGAPVSPGNHVSQECVLPGAAWTL
ncbi:hypothetical protein GPL21_35235 [Bradyrhizobium pachyrhizi]|uniref:Uncharacterized protein n=1 Tax=Bradyrhizobium pachyrhizi TaxID=280333 RepID=A0A844T5I4_9BRAD|nr:hypothetical protein [Bradyrhizobium pachyrhizi]